MATFFSIVPYLLAVIVILQQIVDLLKKREEDAKKPKLRVATIVLFIVVSILTLVALVSDNGEKKKAQKQAQADMSILKTEAKTANDAQRDNTKLFLDSLNKMSTEVSNLKTEVKTEKLQRQLVDVQTQLERTQKALAPGPKAELVFTFLPYNNPPINSSVVPTPVTDTYLLINRADNSVHVECGALNLTSVDAADVDLNIQICDACKYAKEPSNSAKLPGFSDTIRFMHAPHVQGLQVLTPITLDIIVPPGIKNFPVGFTYRCTTCAFSNKPSLGMVHVLGR